MIAVGLLAVGGASASTFGVNAHVPNDAVADRIVEAGIEWVRIDFLWSKVEIERDVYDWRVYDALVDRLEARGLEAYATLQGTPAWATSGPEFSGVPDDVAQWQEFVYLAAKRYRGRIAAWGIWNEPNLEHFWAGSRTDYIEKTPDSRVGSGQGRRSRRTDLRSGPRPPLERQVGHLAARGHHRRRRLISTS